MADLESVLERISTVPSDPESFDDWLKLKDATAFLKENAQDDEFVVHAVVGHTYMHAILVPASSVTPPDVEDLMSWSCNATSAWGISVTLSKPQSVYISPPLDQTGSKTLDKGEQLVFARRFDGRLDSESYYEFLQKFVHISELHFLEERNAYCRLDKHGDIEDVIRIVEVPRIGDDYGGTIITVKRAVLDEYLTLTDFAVVRTFDFTRFRSSGFGGWSDRHDIQFTTENDLFYRAHYEPGHASYMRGCQIVRSATTKDSIIRRFDRTVHDNEKQYASFIAQDWKNKVIREISCAPGSTANYFTKSDLPFELSPAFFRPEVLSKYKMDNEKYRLEERSISCRGTWHLETYDINEIGQVHTYLVYLRDLPYEEQLYWKAHNERPKGPISKRAFKNDFEGSWDFEYDPLNSLKAIVLDLIRQQVPWWTLRSEKLPDQVHYPVTSSADEWANEILNVDQLVVEGFETVWLRNRVQKLGGAADPQFASLKLVEEYLVALGFATGDAKRIAAPLRTTHELRTKLKGHASGEEAIAIRQRILKEHRSYKEHFRRLCGECDASVRVIADAFKNLEAIAQPSVRRS